MPRYHNINGNKVQFTAEEEAARDAEEQAWADGAVERAQGGVSRTGGTGAANTGNGGEGREGTSAYAGGSGVIILRWTTADATIGATRTGLVDGGVQQAGSDSYIIFTGGSGNITFSSP